MADLKSDVIGQVARLPLKPSEANALLPLYEAVSNAVHTENWIRLFDRAVRANRVTLCVDDRHDEFGARDSPVSV